MMVKVHVSPISPNFSANLSWDAMKHSFHSSTIIGVVMVDCCISNLKLVTDFDLP